MLLHLEDYGNVFRTAVVNSLRSTESLFFEGQTTFFILHWKGSTSWQWFWFPTVTKRWNQSLKAPWETSQTSLAASLLCVPNIFFMKYVFNCHLNHYKWPCKGHQEVCTCVWFAHIHTSTLFYGLLIIWFDKWSHFKSILSWQWWFVIHLSCATVTVKGTAHTKMKHKYFSSNL